jgi:hypothetical protein
MSAALADLPLFAAPRPKPRAVPKPGIDPKPIRPVADRFEEFLAANPHVYTELVRLAREAKARGAKKIGMRMCWEVLRWQLSFRTERPAGEFKLNDHLAPKFARLIMAREPDLDGVFELRGGDQ